MVPPVAFHFSSISHLAVSLLEARHNAASWKLFNVKSIPADNQSIGLKLH
eukprot:m.932628 g.932628  ORF g.932628 m.932628 type:complete len:50 (-) comp23791_c0_seq2:53-202(-)